MNRLTHEYPLFTVMIPTKNRESYLYHTLKTCLNQDYPNLEIIIADDASTDNTVQMVKEFADQYPFVKLFTQTESLGMRDNFEFALKQVKPGYLIALGGDDGLLPNGISEMYKIITEYKVDLLTWAPPVYTYPFNNKFSAQLDIYKTKGVEIIKSTDLLNRLVKNLNYLNDLECPMFYVKGVVKTDLVEKVCSRSEDGRFYRCPTPDGYSGIILAGEVEKFAFTGKPLSIYGATGESQGLNYLLNTKKAKIESEFFFKKVQDVPMHQELASQPYSPLITLMTADYLMTARDLQKWDNTILGIDYKSLLQKSIIELSQGIYDEARIGRELKILKQIAIQHDLVDYFYMLVNKTKRKKTRKPFKGDGISPKIVFSNATLLGLDNIFDASYGAKIIYAQISRFNAKYFFKILYNSLKYYFKKSKKDKKFPSEDKW